MKKMLFAWALLLGCCVMAAEYKFELKSSKPWKIKVNEEITFSARLLSRKDAKSPFVPLKGAAVSCQLVGDGMKTVYKKAVSSDGFVTLSGKLDRPGWIYAAFYMLDEKGKNVTAKNSAGKTAIVHGGIGALVEPEKLKVGKEEPKDFDAFWKSQRERLNKVPLTAKLTEVKNHKFKGFKLYDVQVSCAGDMPMSGYLTVPEGAKAKTLAAYVTYQGAGVSGSWINVAKNAITMNINAHGIPNGHPKDYYVNLSRTTLKTYWHKNKNDRDKIYFNGMYLRVMRSLDFIKSRPEWDGKTLIVSGSSQGGGQAIAAAALDPQVTLCVAAVAALSDHSGSLADRQPGWPRFYDVRGKGKADPKVIEAAAYYDNVFFARRIKCETWLTTGLFDRTCSPAGVYVVYNNLAAAKKDLDVFPEGGHGGAPAKKGHLRIKAVLDGKK